MTIYESKENWAKEHGWEDWAEFDYKASKETMLCVLHWLFESLIKEVRHESIDKCAAIVRSRQDCFCDSVDPLVDELLNIKEKP